MRKTIILLPLWLLLAIPLLTAQGQSFSAVSPSGHTLYYQANGLQATLMPKTQQAYTSSYDNLTGRVVVPSKVPYGSDSLTVTRVHNRTFFACNDLTSVVLPPTITTLESLCFYSCRALQSIHIGPAVDTIEDLAIYTCPSIDTITVDTANTRYDSRGDCNAIICTADSTLLFGCRRTVVPSTVRHIGQCAFYHNTPDTLVLPEGVRTIGYGAFLESFASPRLRVVHLPITMRTIGESAFEGCQLLNDLQLNEGLESIGVKAFISNQGLTEVTLPTTLRQLDASAFAGCIRLHTLHFNPDSCALVGRYYFGNNSTAFANCDSLDTLIIGPNVRYIAPHAFRNLASISELSLPAAIHTIGDYAFEGCTGLTRVIYGGTLGDWCRIDFGQWGNPLINAHRLYVADTLVTHADIPSDITEIRPYTFLGDTALHSATLPSTVESIGFASFMNCTGLRQVTLQAASLTVRGRAFEGCCALTRIDSHVLNPRKAGIRAFEQMNTHLPVYIPTGSRSRYEAAWSPLTNFIESYTPSGAIPPPEPEAGTPVLTTMGTDFWSMFLYPAATYPSFGLVITSEEDAVVTVEQPRHHWDTTVYLRGGGSETVLIPTDRATRNYSVTPEVIMNHGVHVTSSAPIALFSVDYGPYSYDVATVYPTVTLDTHYIVQGYPSERHAIVGLLAVEDSTVLQIHTHCSSISYTDGSSVTLMRGQVLQLRDDCGYPDLFGHTYFNGMEVVSNGKPFALFSGASQIALHCESKPGSCCLDHCYEQATPTSTWGQRFLLTSPALKTGGDWVVVTASKDSTVLTLDGIPLDTIDRRQHHRLFLPPDTVRLLEASAPVGVSLYFTAADCNNGWGDPSSVTLPPLKQGTSMATFNAVTSEGVTDHFVNLCAPTGAAPYITLDGNPIGSHFTPHDSTLSYARLRVSPGTHTLRCSHGTFTGWFYGLGPYESYSYPAAMSLHPEGVLLLANGTLAPTEERCLQTCVGNDVELVVSTTGIDTAAYWIIDSVHLSDNAMRIRHTFDTPGLHHVIAMLRGSCMEGFCDTVEAYICVSSLIMDTLDDTFCLGEGYLWRGHTLDSVGTYTFRIPATTGCDTLLTLNLTARGQRVDDTLWIVINEGENIVIDGISYSQDGFFHHASYPLPTGCDSVITVHVTVLHHEPLNIYSNVTDDGICPGDTAVLFATPDTVIIHWTAVPPDPTLAGRDTCHRIEVNPLVTTTYSLLELADTGQTVTIHVYQAPKPCVETVQDYVDFDNPIIRLNDCSENSTSSLWQLANGETYSGTRLQQMLSNLTEDSLMVTLVTCNHQCCADTTISLPMKYSSFWFPNVFTPGKATNRTFGILTRKSLAFYELSIYNKTGERFFRTNNPAETWDGTLNGHTVPQGAYVYHYTLLFSDPGSIPLSGTGIITLLR